VITNLNDEIKNMKTLLSENEKLTENSSVNYFPISFCNVEIVSTASVYSAATLSNLDVKFCISTCSFSLAF
jgi:hypothetical protein